MKSSNDDSRGGPPDERTPGPTHRALHAADDRDLRGLLRDLEPDTRLEESTVAALRERGLLGTAVADPNVRISGDRAAAAWPRRVVAIAAAVTLFAAGMGAGRVTAPQGTVGPGDSGPAGDLMDSSLDPAEVRGPNEGPAFLADASTRAGDRETRVIQWF